MTTNNFSQEDASCPAEGILRQLSGKLKPQIFRLALDGPVRFNSLLRQLPGSNRQSVATALKEIKEAGILTRTIVKEKPLHIEYGLSDKGVAMVTIFKDVESLLQ